MELKTIVVGPLQTNCYLLIKNNECLIIDPGDNADKIKSEIKDYKLIGIIITHHHFDHTGALNNFPNIPIYDYHNLTESEHQIGSFIFYIIHTLGHSDDSISIYFKNEKLMFSGDFLFKETIGRTDFETGSMKKMKESILRIKNYDNEIMIYPGHGAASSLGHEKRYNPYF